MKGSVMAHQLIEKFIFPKSPPLFNPNRGAVTSGWGVGVPTNPFLMYFENFDDIIFLLLRSQQIITRYVQANATASNPSRTSS